MKKISFLVLLTAITVCSFSQVTDEPVKPMLKADYLQKSKNQKTTAFVLLGLGAALDIGGIIATISNADKEVDYIFSTQSSSVNHGAEYALYIAGTACLMGSLTLFIVSKNNKKKALALGIDTQQFRQLNKSNLYTVNYPALTLKIKL
jgi:hypothetical protein